MPPPLGTGSPSSTTRLLYLDSLPNGPEQLASARQPTASAVGRATEPQCTVPPCRPIRPRLAPIRPRTSPLRLGKYRDQSRTRTPLQRDRPRPRPCLWQVTVGAPRTIRPLDRGRNGARDLGW